MNQRAYRMAAVKLIPEVSTLLLGLHAAAAGDPAAARLLERMAAFQAGRGKVIEVCLDPVLAAAEDDDDELVDLDEVQQAIDAARTN